MNSPVAMPLRRAVFGLGLAQVAITTIGLETGHMRSDNAAALVGAAMVSVLVFPLAALTVRRREGAAERPFTPSA